MNIICDCELLDEQSDNSNCPICGRYFYDFKQPQQEEKKKINKLQSVEDTIFMIKNGYRY